MTRSRYLERKRVSEAGVRVGPTIHLVSTADAARLLRTIREDEVRWRGECLIVLDQVSGIPAGWLDLDWRLDRGGDRARRAAAGCARLRPDRDAPPGAWRLYAGLDFRLPSQPVASSRPGAWKLELR